MKFDAWRSDQLMWARLLSSHSPPTVVVRASWYVRFTKANNVLTVLSAAAVQWVAGQDLIQVKFAIITLFKDFLCDAQVLD